MTTCPLKVLGAAVMLMAVAGCSADENTMAPTPPLPGERLSATPGEIALSVGDSVEVFLSRVDIGSPGVLGTRSLRPATIDRFSDPTGSGLLDVSLLPSPARVAIRARSSGTSSLRVFSGADSITIPVIVANRVEFQRTLLAGESASADVGDVLRVRASRAADTESEPVNVTVALTSHQIDRRSVVISATGPAAASMVIEVGLLSVGTAGDSSVTLVDSIGGSSTRLVLRADSLRNGQGGFQWRFVRVPMRTGLKRTLSVPISAPCPLPADLTPNLGHRSIGVGR